MTNAMNIAKWQKAGGAWVNPYVTDGLVAMWDGEWNAGGGVHDANATSWVDLSGNNHDMIISAGSFGADCYTSAAVKDSAKCADSDEIAEPYTIEMVVNLKSAPSTCLFMGNKKRTIGLYPDGRIFDGGNKYDGSGSTLGFFAGAIGKMSYSAYKRWESMYYPTEAVVNGAVQTPTSGTDSWYGYASLVFGLNNYGWSYYGVADFHNIRLYNRALTASEVAANYAVDAERFGLTD